MFTSLVIQIVCFFLGQSNLQGAIRSRYGCGIIPLHIVRRLREVMNNHQVLSG